MARLRRFDRWLLALLIPVWLLCAGLSCVELLRGGPARPGFWIAGAAGPESPPRILEFERDAVAQRERRRAGLHVGDELLRAGGVDLRGMGPLSVWATMLAHAGPHRHVQLTVRGAHGSHTADWPITRGLPLPWRELVIALGFAVPGVLVLLQRSDAPEARALFAFCMSFSFANLIWNGGPEAQTFAWVAVQTLAVSLSAPLAVRFALLLPAESAPRGRAALLLPFLLLPVGLFHRSLINGVPFPPDVGARGFAAFGVVTFGWILAATVRNFRRSGRGGRRKIEWAVLGWFVALAPVGIAAFLTALDPPFLRLMFVSTISLVALPACLGIAIVRDRLFDIDRLLSATASYTLLLFLGFAALLAAVPGLSDWASSVLGIPLPLAQLGIAAVLAAILVPVNRWVRPWLEGWIIPERRAVQGGFEALLEDLDHIETPEQVPLILDARTAALLRVEEHAVLVREEGALRMRESAPWPEERIDLAGLETRLRDLARRDGPLRVERDGKVLLPVKADGDLYAVVVLGRKHSGDPYGPAELGLLAGATEKASATVQRHQDAQRISEERRRAAHIDARRRRAEVQVLARSRFLATASHDLRQPLHALGMLVDALDRRPLDPQSRVLVERIHASAESLRALFDSLLDISRLDAGAVEPEVGDVPLAPLLERLVDEHRPLALAKGLDLQVTETSLGVRSDPVLLARILQNLLSNALRYTESGGVRIHSRADGANVIVAVEDTGSGISPEDQREIFREFVRLEGRERAEGLGLGLAIVDRLSALLGHELRLESTPGRGSTFRISAPRAEHPARRPRAPGDGSPFAGQTILVLDDDAATRAGMRDLLQSWGLEPLTAADAEEVLAELGQASAQPSAVLADLDLGANGSGLDAIARIQAALVRPLPALVISGDTRPEAAERIRAAGYPLLTKPVAPVRLRAALASLLAR